MTAVIIVVGEWIVLLRRFCKRRMRGTVCFRIGQGIGRQSAYTSASTHTCHCLCSLSAIGTLTTRHPTRPSFIYCDSFIRSHSHLFHRKYSPRSIPVRQPDCNWIHRHGSSAPTHVISVHWNWAKGWRICRIHASGKDELDKSNWNTSIKK